jgi:hypothetical protein
LQLAAQGEHDSMIIAVVQMIEQTVLIRADRVVE